MPPVEFCFGVNRAHAAKSRPRRNWFIEGLKALTADAVIAPTPGSSSACLFSVLGGLLPEPLFQRIDPGRLFLDLLQHRMGQLCDHFADHRRFVVDRGGQSSTRACPAGTMTPNSARCPRKALTFCVR